MQRNQKGFSAVEGLLILFIVGLVGFIGWYVYHSKNNAEATLSQADKTANLESINTVVGLKTYSDDFVSLKYPANWSVKRDDNTNLPGTKNLVLTGPNDNEVASSIGISRGQSAHLSATIFKGVTSEATEAKVYDVVSLNIPNHSSAKLVVIADTRPAQDPSGPAAQFAVTDDPDVKVGSTKLKNGVSVGSETIGISVVAMEYPFKNLDTLINSQSVQELIKVLNSLSFK